MKNAITLVACLLFSNLVLSQGPPPAAAMPDKENHELIFEIVEASRYDLFFEYQKNNIVEKMAAKYNWSEEKTASVKAKIIYDADRWDFLNGYSLYTKAELNEIKAYLKTLPLSEFELANGFYASTISSNIKGSIARKCKQEVEQ
jgi:hypothetical protein